MNSGMLRKSSVATLALAAVLGLYAFRLSRQVEQPLETSAASEAALPKIVVAAHALEAGAVIRSGDIELAPVAVAPAGAFGHTEDVVDKATAVALAAGEPVLEEHFVAASALRNSLLPGERALAVKTDGVVGLGGFVEPGDRVDVLLYLQQDGREIEASQARLLLRDVRVLAYGARTLGKTPEREPAEARTAVLAVSEDQAPALMLGAHKGQLRLALRGEVSGAEPWREEGVATVADLIGTPPSAQPRERPRVVIYRGTQRQESTP